MKVMVRRRWFTKRTTISDVLIDGAWMFFGLEDRVRGPGYKVKAATAIPPGVYDLIIDRSQRFGRDMPHVLDVPMFQGIRIHAGNTEHDTEGCLLLGGARLPDKVLHSRFAVESFMEMINDSSELWPVGAFRRRVHVDVRQLPPHDQGGRHVRMDAWRAGIDTACALRRTSWLARHASCAWARRARL